MSQEFNRTREKRVALLTLLRELRLAAQAERVVTYQGNPVYGARLSTLGDFVVVYYSIDGKKYRESDGGVYASGIWPFTPAYEALLGQLTS